METVTVAGIVLVAVFVGWFCCYRQTRQDREAQAILIQMVRECHNGIMAKNCQDFRVMQDASRAGKPESTDDTVIKAVGRAQVRMEDDLNDEEAHGGIGGLMPGSS